MLEKQAPEPYRGPATARLAARVALLRGDNAAACEKLRQSATLHEQVGAADEAARERFALGATLGGEEGQNLQRSALDALLRLGVSRPLLDVRAYYPELFERVSQKPSSST